MENEQTNKKKNHTHVLLNLVPNKIASYTIVRMLLTRTLFHINAFTL